MNRRIKAYVDKLFADKPDESSVRDLKDEISANLNDKYYDLLFEGKNKDEAYLLTIASIGDIDELLNDFAANDLPEVVEINNSNFNEAEIDEENERIEQVKPDKDVKPAEKLKPATNERRFTFLICILSVAAYVVIGLIFDCWTVTLTLLPLGAFISILLVFLKEKKKGLIYGMLWTGAGVVYFFMSFTLNGRAWSWTWLIFIGALAAQIILIKNLKK